jgi:hypothetical protein
MGKRILYVCGVVLLAILVAPGSLAGSFHFGKIAPADTKRCTCMIRKGQVRWLEKGDVTGQIQFIHQLFGIAA